MRNHLSILTLTAIILLISDLQAAGYIKFDGVDGEVVVSEYAGWSEFVSVSQRISRENANEQASGFSRRALEGAEFDALVIIKPLDKASLKYAEAVLKNRVFPKVFIEWVYESENGPLPYYRYALENARVTEYFSKGVANSESYETGIHEEITVDFESITMTYTVYDEQGNPQGNVEFSW